MADHYPVLKQAYYQAGLHKLRVQVEVHATGELKPGWKAECPEDQAAYDQFNRLREEKGFTWPAFLVRLDAGE